MSSKNNVNPDHYKTRGSLRQGEDVLQDEQKKEYSQSRSNKGEQNLIPGGSPKASQEQAKTEKNAKKRRTGKS
jgi:hypothetical protein